MARAASSAHKALCETRDWLGGPSVVMEGRHDDVFIGVAVRAYVSIKNLLALVSRAPKAGSAEGATRALPRSVPRQRRRRRLPAKAQLLRHRTRRPHLRPVRTCQLGICGSQIFGFAASSAPASP